MRIPDLISCLHCAAGGFEEENGVAYFYIQTEKLTFNNVPMLPSLAWFQNNCYMNAALHAVGALSIWQTKEE